MTTVRTRFAPSPTGTLHIGGARTALFCWLYARHNNGTYILRIEDTDKARSTDESVQAIHDGLSWLGLTADEGPYYQTQRFDQYKKVIAELIENNHAYKCYCSKERLDALRTEQQAQKIKPRYDGRCKNQDQSQEAPHVIRFKNPESGAVSFDDLVRGTITIQNSELDDLIIQRTDGTPTYNLTVVVDDIDMNITHVIRGDDHINNTPRQINIFKALNLKIPTYAHVPMILGEDGKKLSKRAGAASVMDYREQGFLPIAVLNYFVRLGWSHGDQEIFSLDEMIQYFELTDINKSSGQMNPDKLLWINQHYLKTADNAVIKKELVWHLEQLGVCDYEAPNLDDLIAAQRDRCKTVKEMAEKSQFFYKPVQSYEEKAAKKNLNLDQKATLLQLQEAFKTLHEWNTITIHQVIEKVAEAHDGKLGKVAQPIRVAVSGGTVSPPIDITLELLGQSRTIERLENAIDYINTIK